mmetsp:Transcript_22572/g.45096  ORF Transcript_22572/g.45096 Transcript_22572/m.45096 type:complete len:261 (+) Transcript_22572:120-902(+)
MTSHTLSPGATSFPYKSLPISASLTSTTLPATTLCDLKARFATVSSSLWYVSTAQSPPGLTTRGRTVVKSLSRLPISSFTATLMAWKTLALVFSAPFRGLPLFHLGVTASTAAANSSVLVSGLESIMDATILFADMYPSPPYFIKISTSSSSDPSFTTSAALGPSSLPMRMSRGPALSPSAPPYLKPRDVSSIWWDDTPKSARTKSTCPPSCSTVKSPKLLRTCRKLGNDFSRLPASKAESRSLSTPMTSTSVAPFSLRS